jgi:hypothetical protein
MRLLIALLLTAGLAASVHAQTVQKCVSRDGRVRYQSEPCPSGMRTAETYDAAPDPTVPAPVARRARASTARPRVSRRASRGQFRAVAGAPDACEQARAFRDDTERRVGLARNYELLSALQRRVYDACR